MKIVICGGGIIGSSIAYFLAKRGLPCTIVEEESIACAASGKAGGFLARNFGSTRYCDELTQLSFRLHMELAKIFDDADYRNVDAYSVNIDKDNTSGKTEIPDSMKWIDGNVTEVYALQNKNHSAQVHPKKLSQRFALEAQNLTNNATKVLQDTVIGLQFDSNSATKPIVKAVKLQSGQTLDADVVVIAMGPWSHKAVSWFPSGSIPKISGYRSNSIILKHAENVSTSADCLFLEFTDRKCTSSPEIYPRPDGTVYLCGFGITEVVPNKASDINVDKAKCGKLREIAEGACSALKSAELVAEQACFLPISPDDMPVIGKISTVEGAFIATGHSCWGILNSTGTGFAIAELIASGQCKSVDLRPFDPARFRR